MTFPGEFRQTVRSLAVPVENQQAQILAVLKRCRRLLETVDIPTVLHRVVGEEFAPRALGQLSGCQHFGFLGPSNLASSVWAALAQEAGFLENPQHFQSEILARELSWRLGGQPVRVTVMKVETTLASGRRGGIEVFFPEVEFDTGRRWVAEGLGAHLGLGLKSSENLDQVQQICRQRGYTLPPFLDGQPATNRSHGVRVLYLEDRLESGPFRWEFYHSSTEAGAIQPSTMS